MAESARALPPVVPAGPVLAWPSLPSLARIKAIELDWELAAYIALIAIAFTIRIWDVGARAMHHDESLHATYAWYLFQGRGYQYNPLMHGPLQFYVMAFFYMLFGDSETTARLFAVLSGTAIVFLPYLLRHRLGQAGALVAAVGLTVSPAFLYYSRFARDDIYLAFFGLLMAVAIWRLPLPKRETAPNGRDQVSPAMDRRSGEDKPSVGLGPPTLNLEAHAARRGLDRRERRLVYILAAAAALAMSVMEAAYILFFVFGSYFGLILVLERFRAREKRPLTNKLKAVPVEVWLTSAIIFLGITILLYSTFLSNPAGVIDLQHGLLSRNRQDILGGITYWLSQHGVARGGQPWFYYLLLLPLYEQFALIFATAGLVWAFFRRDAFVSFLAYWFVLSMLIYGWAGEKMPWLFLHPLLPAILLGGTFAGWLLSRSTGGWRAFLMGGIAILLVVELHSAQALAFSNAANPTEMLIYVQTSNDVPLVAREAIQIARRVGHRAPKPLIQVDGADLQGWPFEWYFRNLPAGAVTYSSNFANATAPVLITLGPERSTYGSALLSRYVSSKYIWNWWFPEDYKGLTLDDGRCGTAANETACAPGERGTVFLRTGTPCPAADVSGGPNCSVIQDVPAINALTALSRASTWQRLWNWFAFRTPFGQRGSRELDLFVRRNLAPKGSGSTPGSATGPPAPYRALSYRVAFRLTGGASRSAGVLSARGLAVGNAGRLYIADAGYHRIDEFSRAGSFLRAVGGAGTGSGQFNINQSPMAVALGRGGDLYAADFWNHRIEQFSPSGRFVRAWGRFATAGPYGFYGPRSIAIAPDGNVVVADTGNRQVAVFSPTGAFRFRIGSAGTAAGQFEEPSSVAVTKNGDIYVADFWNARIQYFDGSGRYIGSWPVPGWVNGSYAEPYLTLLSNGDIAASVPDSGQIDVFHPTGKPVGTISTAGVASPLGIAGIRNGGIVVSDLTSGQVYVLVRSKSHGAPAGTPPVASATRAPRP